MKFAARAWSIATLVVATTAPAESLLIRPTQPLTQQTLVTTGIPVQPNALVTAQNVTIFDDAGNEVPAYVEPTIHWYDAQGNATSIRAVKVQFYVPSNTGDVNYSFEFGPNATRTEHISEQSVETSLMVSSDPAKANTKHAKVLAVLDPEYLERSKLIPSFSSADSKTDFENAQNAWAYDLDFRTTTLANWLFDRPTSLYKSCMRNGDTACYKEAYQSYRFWMNSLKRDGDVNSCKGGSLLGGTTKACDTKYTYIEQIKLHVALTGDDTLHDAAFVHDLATLINEQFYYQTKVDDPYDSESESFTERTAGLSLSSLVAAYELTGDSQYLTDINTRVDVLYDHLKSNPDNLGVDGTWRHSWAKHEGSTYPGDGVKDDRRFSPWMSENIIDALWHVYHVNPSTKLEEMFRLHAEALVKWGFTDSEGYKQLHGKTIDEYAGKRWHSSCNTTGDTLLYSASSVASLEAIHKTQESEGWYSDLHSPQALFSLSLGYLFESDEVKRAAIKARVHSLSEGFLNGNCGAVASTKRLFNWQNRSNFLGTLYYVNNTHPGFLPAALDPNYTAGDKGTPTYYDDLLDGFAPQWQDPNSAFALASSGMKVSALGVASLPTISVPSEFAAEVGFVGSSSATLGAGVVIGHDSDGYYSVRVKSGPWGGVFIYQHTNSVSGQLVFSVSTEVDYDVLHKLTVVANKASGEMVLFMDGTEVGKFMAESTKLDGTLGLVGITKGNNIHYSSFAIYDSNPFEQTAGGPNEVGAYQFDFQNGVMEDDFFNFSQWVHDQGVILPTYKGWLLTVAYHDTSDYALSSSFNLDGANASLSFGVVFAQSDTHYYSAKLKAGQWGGLYIYRHRIDASWDVAGQFVASTPVQIPLGQDYLLEATVINDVASLSLNGTTELLEIVNAGGFQAGDVGFVTSVDAADVFIKSFAINY